MTHDMACPDPNLSIERESGIGDCREQTMNIGFVEFYNKYNASQFQKKSQFFHFFFFLLIENNYKNDSKYAILKRYF